jgi:hypothetical protein
LTKLGLEQRQTNESPLQNLIQRQRRKTKQPQKQQTRTNTTTNTNTTSTKTTNTSKMPTWLKNQSQKKINNAAHNQQLHDLRTCSVTMQATQLQISKESPHKLHEFITTQATQL